MTPSMTSSFRCLGMFASMSRSLYTRSMSDRPPTALFTGLLLALMLAGCSGEVVSDRKVPYWVFVTDERSGDLTVFDGESRKPVATIRVGPRPRGIHASPDGRLLYVALSGAGAAPESIGIGVVDVASRRLVRRIPVGFGPEDLAVSPDGSRLFVTDEDAGAVCVVNASTDSIEARVKIGPEAEGLRFAPDGRVVYVASEFEGVVYVLDADDGSVRSKLAVGGRPRAVELSPDGSK